MASPELPRRSLSYRIAFPVIWRIGRLLLKILGSFRSIDAHRFPRSGGILIVANHRSDVDPVAIQASIRREIYFMAKSELFEMRGLGPVIRWFGAFPVQRGAPDRQALKIAIGLLKRGEAVCIFPEGQIGDYPHLLPLLPGVALVAKASGVPIIPCGLQSTEEIRSMSDPRIRRARRPVEVRWGTIREGGDHSDTARLLEWMEAELERLGQYPQKRAPDFSIGEAEGTSP